jgi:phosphohistidine phosphatase
MNLYFLRHGLAGDRDVSRYPDDSQRPLVPEGRRKLRCIAAGMHALDLQFDVLLSSPYVRACQTAEIVAGAFHMERKLQLADDLAPEGSARRLVRLLKTKHSAANNLLLVGHEPYLGELIGVLLAGKPGWFLDLKKGGLCLLSAESLVYGPCARLEWLLTPRQLMALAP